MPQPTSLMALPDARAALERASLAPQGIRLRFPTKGKAEAFRFRCYTVRQREARRIALLYPESTIDGRGATPWDAFIFQVKSAEDVGEDGDHWYLYIIGTGMENMLQIEEL